MIRQHRVEAFAIWLGTAPTSPPFHQQPEFRFFRDLTPEEFSAAARIMEREAERLNAEADALEAEGKRRDR